MFRSQLIRLLITLTPKEVKQFGKYLNSPFFNSHQDTIRLFEVLEAAYPHFSNVESEEIFKELFPDQPYKDEVLRTLRKYLLSHLKDFLAYQNWIGDKHAPALRLLKDLNDRNTEDDFIKEYKKSKSALKREPIQDADHFLSQFYQEKYWVAYEATHVKRKTFPNLKPSSTALDHFYLTEKLQLMMVELSNQRIYNSEPGELGLQDEILNHVLNHLEDFPHIIQIYGLACQFLLVDKNSEAIFLKFRNMLVQNTRVFNEDDLSTLYICAINYANRGYLHGKKEYLQLMFELYNEMLELDLLFEGKTFSLNNYKNLATIGLRLRKLEWAEDFIETYKIYLNEENWEGVYNYNLAHLYIYQKKYSEALRLLNEVTFVDSYYQLGTKMLQLKVYYEQEDVEMFFTLAKTFETHIKRQKEISENRKNAFLNFIKTTKAVFRIHIGEKNNHERVGNMIVESVPLIEKEWVQLKLEELS